MVTRNSSGVEGIAPVVQEVTVNQPANLAFEHFTSRIAEWWPVPTHSVAPEQVASVVFETGVGGRIYELHRDGTTAEWGRVTAWDPPHRVCFTWYPGRDPATAGDVEVTFEPVVAASTRVTLVHTGWERLGDRAIEVRNNYVSGWQFVFVECYGAAASRRSGGI